MFCCRLISLFWSSSSILEPIGGPISDPRYTTRYIHTKTKAPCIGRCYRVLVWLLTRIHPCQQLWENWKEWIGAPIWVCPPFILCSKKVHWVPGVAAKQLEQTPPEEKTIWIDRFCFEKHVFENRIDQSIQLFSQVDYAQAVWQRPQAPTEVVWNGI